MSQPITPTTKDTTDSGSKKAKDRINKDSIIDNRDDLDRAISLSKREKIPYPVVVTSDYFDTLTDGHTEQPFMWKGDGIAANPSVAIVDQARKDQAFELLSGGKRIV